MAGRVARTLVWAAIVASAGVAGTGARADGLPVLGVDVGSVGVVSGAGDARYVTLPAGLTPQGRRLTAVARVSPYDGRVNRSTLLPGNFTIPAVAYDSSASGLSGDGRTLVLIEPRLSFPRARTTLAVLDARWLRVQSIVHLRGDFSFDAVSPDGTWLYLVQYVSPRDPNRYLVRSYDLRAHRLLAEPVTDPRNRSEKMRGSPITRVASTDGRFAYTLYDGAGATPFVHALDTRARTARCIDLPGLDAAYVSRLRLTLGGDGSRLTVRRGREVEAVIDTRSYRVGLPPPRSAHRSDVSGSRWLLLAIGGSGLAAAAAGVAVALHRRRTVALPA